MVIEPASHTDIAITVEGYLEGLRFILPERVPEVFAEYHTSLFQIRTLYSTILLHVAATAA